MLLVDLPRELVAHVVARLDDPREISRSAGISKLFHNPPPPDPNANANTPPPHSLAEEGIRLWLQMREIELPAICVGDTCAVRSLCYLALLRNSPPPAAGRYHSLFIDGDGRLSSCGGGSTVACITGHGRLWPTRQGVAWQSRPLRLSTLDERVVAVSAGIFHSLAITADGAVWSWGGGPGAAHGQLGHGDQRNQSIPKRVEAFAGQRVVAVSAGMQHSLAITADGSVWSWGRVSEGQLGHGDPIGDLHGEMLPIEPREVQLLPKKVEAFVGQRVVAVSAGDDNSLAITADGAVWSWGRGFFGKLGHGDSQTQLLPKKIEGFAGQRIVAVSAAEQHSLAITADGAVWSWGRGTVGKLGHGVVELQLRQPKKIEAFAGQCVVAVSAGGDHSLAITADGAVWSWGSQDQLGHGDFLEATHYEATGLPVKVEAFAGRRVVAVSAGFYHNLALTADGAVWSWGRDNEGVLGRGIDDDYDDDDRSSAPPYNPWHGWVPKKIKVWL